MLLCVGEFFDAENDTEWQAVQKGGEIEGKQLMDFSVKSCLWRNLCNPW